MKKNLLFKVSAAAILLVIYLSANAQFTIREPFKSNSINSSIVIGGNATLTSGNADGQGNEWLRLTRARTNEKGFAYINKSFPSKLGIEFEFEYKAWRNVQDAGYNGADGFSVFLFDANSTFQLGGNGGSLGYAPNNGSDTITKGLAGGYVGVGLDEYGNYSNPTEMRIGGPGLKPNSIVLRGPTTNNSATTNRYISGYQINSSTNANAVDYNNITPTRPSDADFYRKVEVIIQPENGQYRVIVNFLSSTTGSYETMINSLLTDPLPANLKIGFAASTGGGFNYHEVRNLFVTTPGGVRVTKAVDKADATINTQLKYTVDVFNSTPVALSNLKVLDTLKDINGNILDASTVRIDSVVFNNNGNSGNLLTSAPSKNNPFSATVSLAAATATADARGTFTTYATVLKKPAGGIITNRVGLDYSATGITDTDTTNNNDSVHTNIIQSNIAITSAMHNDVFYAGDQNQKLLVDLKNNGPDASTSSTVVKDTIPNGFTFNGTGTITVNGWEIYAQGNIITATYNGTVANGASYPQLQIPVNVSSTVFTLPSTNVVSKYGATNIADNILTNNNATDNITVYNLKPGVIAANQTINSGNKPNPLTVATQPTGSNNDTYTYQWQVSTDGVTFTNITGATNATYSPGSLTQTMHYRRVDNAPERDQAALPTNVVTITIHTTVAVSYLQNLKASEQNGNVLLSWVTGVESDSKGFAIERSSDGKSYTEIAFLSAKGNNNSYSFMDNTPFKGINYYRLAETDVNNNRQLSNTVQIHVNASGTLLYPNPAKNQINIIANGAVIIYDISGRKVLSQVVNNKATINISHLAKGLYILKTNTESIKFIKE